MITDTQGNFTTTSMLDAVSVSVVLMWTQINWLYSYNVSVTPSVEMTFNGGTTVQLILSYNTQYNVSVVATHPCLGRIITKMSVLHYGKYFS